MASVIIKRDTLANINATPITDGQLLFSTDQSNDNDKIYADVGSERKVIGGRTDVVNNLTSTDIDKALSANMGKELSDSVNIGFTKSNIQNLAYEATSLGENGDLNNAPLGVSWTPNTCSNLPYNDYGMVVTYAFSKVKIQMWIRLNIQVIYVRMFNSGSWRAWGQI